MSSTANMNFREIYFEHKDMMHIVGKPTFGPLQAMLLQLKSNASSVPWNFRGNHMNT